MLLHCSQSAAASDTFEHISADSEAAVVLVTLLAVAGRLCSVAMPGVLTDVIKKKVWSGCFVTEKIFA